MHKMLFSFIKHYKCFNFLYRLMLINMYIPELNQIKRSIPIVVSLSSDEDSFDNLEYTLYSLFNQKVSPDKVVLWLSNEYELSELPYSITKFVKKGLDIRFVEDKESYTNIIYALKEFNDCIIVTAEDDIYYSKNWLSKLYHSYISNPNDIQLHSAAYISNNDNMIKPFKTWNMFVSDEQASYNYFPLLSGGVLFPPNCFKKEVFREDIYKKKVNAPWGLWAWVMSVVSDRKIRLVKNHKRRFASTNIIKSFKKYKKIFDNAEQADIQIKQLFEYYGRNINQNLNQK